MTLDGPRLQRLEPASLDPAVDGVPAADGVAGIEVGRGGAGEVELRVQQRPRLGVDVKGILTPTCIFFV